MHLVNLVPMEDVHRIKHSYLTCHSEGAAVFYFFRQLLAPLRTFFTEAKINKYPLGKSASDERECSVEADLSLSEHRCTQLIIFKPNRG
jgi:hypothetical protein